MDNESVSFWRAATFLYRDLLSGTTMDPATFYACMRLLSLYAADRTPEHSLPGQPLPAPLPLPLASAAAWAVRFAAACYGSAGRAFFAVAAQGLSLGALGHAVQTSASSFAALAGVPQGCLAASAGGRSGFPRCFLALDAGARAIVLAVRGTMSWGDVITDCCAASVPFCGGRSHAGMVRAARCVWSALEAPTLQLLARHPGFSLVLTGHSLGGGTASLLCILLNFERAVAEALGRTTPLSGVTITAFAFASPPVFSPVALLPACVHENMCVTARLSARAQQAPPRPLAHCAPARTPPLLPSSPAWLQHQLGAPRRRRGAPLCGLHPGARARGGALQG